MPVFLALVLAVLPPGGGGLEQGAVLDKVESIAREAGYSLEIDGSGQGSATISRGEMRARFHLLSNGYDGSSALGRDGAALSLTMDLKVARELPQRDTPHTYGPLLPRGKTLFAPNLGRTVEAFADVVMIDKNRPATPKKDLDRFFADALAFARKHGGTGAPPPPRDWRRRPLPDDLLLYKPDPTSLRRLIRGWGFGRSPEDASFRRGESEVWARVEGRDVALTKLQAGRDGLEHGVAVSTTLAVPSGVDEARWLRLQARKKDRVKVEAGITSGAYAVEEILLTKPIRAGELRRRMVAVVRKAYALERRASPAFLRPIRDEDR